MSELSHSVGIEDDTWTHALQHGMPDEIEERVTSREVAYFIEKVEQQPEALSVMAQDTNAMTVGGDA